jgi:hypothetical protein
MTRYITALTLLIAIVGACATPSSTQAPTTEESPFQAHLDDVKTKHINAIVTQDFPQAFAIADALYREYLDDTNAAASGHSAEVVEEARAAWESLVNGNVVAVDALWSRNPSAARALFTPPMTAPHGFSIEDFERFDNAAKANSRVPIAKMQREAKALEDGGNYAAALYYWVLAATEGQSKAAVIRAPAAIKRLESRIFKSRRKVFMIGVVGSAPNWGLGRHVEVLNDGLNDGRRFREGRHDDDDATLTLNITPMKSKASVERGEFGFDVRDGNQEVPNPDYGRKKALCDAARRSYDRYFDECYANAQNYSSCDLSDRYSAESDDCQVQLKKVPKTKTEPKYRKVYEQGISYSRRGQFTVSVTLQSNRDKGLRGAVKETVKGVYGDTGRGDDYDASRVPDEVSTFSHLFIQFSFDGMIDDFHTKARQSICPISTEGIAMRGAEGFEAWYPYADDPECKLSESLLTDMMVLLDTPGDLTMTYSEFRAALAKLRSGDR